MGAKSYRTIRFAAAGAPSNLITHARCLMRAEETGRCTGHNGAERTSSSERPARAGRCPYAALAVVQSAALATSAACCGRFLALTTIKRQCRMPAESVKFGQAKTLTRLPFAGSDDRDAEAAWLLFLPSAFDATGWAWACEDLPLVTGAADASC